jgi:hypothetical protein
VGEEEGQRTSEGRNDLDGLGMMLGAREGIRGVDGVAEGARERGAVDGVFVPVGILVGMRVGGEVCRRDGRWVGVLDGLEEKLGSCVGDLEMDGAKVKEGRLVGLNKMNEGIEEGCEEGDAEGWEEGE